MIREHLFKKRAAADPDFRWRGGDISRLEGISDGIFAITITLLIVSTTAPTTFHEMWLQIRDLPAFIASFSLIMMAWHYHYLFFRRYGLEDFTTSLINNAFLFVIMFFAYPLKFLCLFLWRLIIDGGSSVEAELFIVPAGYNFDDLITSNTPQAIKQFQGIGMMWLYGVSFIGVFALLALLQLRAYKKRFELELDDIEVTMTLNAIAHHFISISVTVLSLLVLSITAKPSVSGMVYFLLPFLHGFMGWLGDKRIQKLKANRTNEFVEN